jgi:hypothetical protein
LPMPGGPSTRATAPDPAAAAAAAALTAPTSCARSSSSLSRAGFRPVVDPVSTSVASGASLPTGGGLEGILPSSGRAGEKAQAAKTALILLGEDGRVDCAGQGAALGLNDLLACIGSDHGAAFADLYPAFLGKGATWFADSVHPNDAGISAIAGVLATTAGLPGVALPPMLGLPATVIADATTRRRVVVRYRVTVSDPTDPHPRLSCMPSSGAWFAIGTTMVRCRATNAAGVNATGAFAVAVHGASPLLPGARRPPRVRESRPRERATLRALLERVRPTSRPASARRPAPRSHAS